jgi:hydroxyacylglutathione hydrolase
MAAQLAIEIIPILRDNYAFLLTDAGTGTTGVVDPGEARPVLERLAQSGRRLDWILITHHHGDHTGGNTEIKERTGCRIVGPSAEAARIPGLDLGVGEGESFELGASRAALIATPGHTAGPISYHFADARALFCGDTLFVMGCGRLIEGDARTMWASLGKLMALPDATRVYCGHEYTLANARFAVTVDPENPLLQERLRTVEAARAAGKPTVPSTMGEEKATNPFLRAAEPAIRRRLGLEGADDAEVFAEIRRRKDRA